MFFRYPSPDAKASPSPARGEGYGLLRRCTPRNDAERTNILSKGLDVVCQYAALLERRVQRGTRARKALVVTLQANPLGRSMIEMLGVLAIIGVLSVGGIAGYSKAMSKFKVNKAIGEYSYLIHGLLEHLDEFKISETSAQLPLVDIVKALELVPETYKKYNNSLLSDPYNNYLHIFSSSKKVYISIQMGLTAQNTDGSYSSAGFSTNFCTALFDNIAKPLHSALYEAHVYRTNAANLRFYGDKYCNGDVKCLRNATLKDIYDTCKSCDKKNAACDVTLAFE